jgi:hypothetical protein
MKADLFHKNLNAKLDQIIKVQSEQGKVLRKILSGNISEESLGNLAKSIHRLKRLSKKVF